jgi:hypothetical protein
MCTGLSISLQRRAKLLCVFCNQDHTNPDSGNERTLIQCGQNWFEPLGENVLFISLHDEHVHVSIQDDLEPEVIAKMIAGLMDKISEFPSIQENPSILMAAFMGNSV